ncbi:nonsense-mediated mRNA decay protein 3 [Microthyrium microscopicum]|uniref:60S ribosomal export protein NMD3 n=1 Tax=Microthyrium microscopicum TaxID=703497 RepID=A0A6A6UNB3_9PEZI|nr:nonsense-mediated mRNA decay protein 3 [Microthyrium microscopicum]
MEIDSGVIAIPAAQANTIATILCCNCGVPIDGQTAAGALCTECLKLTVDASQGIQREVILHTCGDCDRWHAPPTSWLVCQPESRELLALCLKRLKGLSKVRIIDASFIWTEPHSRRIKVKITVQQEAFQDTIVQQSFEVEYIVHNQQCTDCKKSYTHHTWRACVQVRQKVPHKRTFLYLEQLILKHGAHSDTINIKEVHDGIDFYFAHRNQAEKFTDFLSSVTPVITKKSQELISHDVHTSTKQYKFTFSAEIVPICKDDLVALPIKLAKSAGNISPLVLCYRIGTSVNVMDPTTLQTAEISSKQFWHTPFMPLADVQELQEFIVLDIEPIGVSKGHSVLADATISPASDFNKTYTVRTHLGAVLHPGDSALGFHLSGSNFNNPQFEALELSRQYASTIPDVVLVKKHYQRSQKKRKNRTWRLKRLAQEESDMAPRKQEQEKLERDYEMFLRDVEEDTELRAGLNLYKQQRQQDEMDLESSMGDDEGLKVPLEELMDEFDEMTIKE